MTVGDAYDAVHAYARWHYDEGWCTRKDCKEESVARRQAPFGIKEE